MRTHFDVDVWHDSLEGGSAHRRVSTYTEQYNTHAASSDPSVWPVRSCASYITSSLPSAAVSVPKHHAMTACLCNPGTRWLVASLKFRPFYLLIELPILSGYETGSASEAVYVKAWRKILTSAEVYALTFGQC
jgi:hypothetical protein